MKQKHAIFLSGIALGLSLSTLTFLRNNRVNETKAEVVSNYHVPKIVDFACGEYHNLAIDSDGNLWQWGCKTDTKTTPQQIMAGTRFKKVAAGLDYSVALDVDGNAYSWTAYGESSFLGSGYDSIGVVAQDKAFLSSSSQIAVSYFPVAYDTGTPFLFLNSDGGLDENKRTYSGGPSIYCGQNAVAAGTKAKYTSNNNYERYYCFTLLDGGKEANGFSITAIGAFYSGSAWYAPRKVVDTGYWPNTVNAKTCAGGNLLSVSIPTEGLYTDFAISKDSRNNGSTLDVSTGFALKSDGKLYSFGYNNSTLNLLGSDDTLSTNGQVDSLKQVKLDKKALGVDSGASHAVALCEDGNLYAWGSNAYGQLGLGDTGNRTLPTLIQFFQSNSQYSFAAAKGETYEGSFAIDGMASYFIDTNPSKGDIVLNASTGAFTYTPFSDATGTDYFTVTVSDGITTKTYIVNVTIDYKPVWQSFDTSFTVRRGGYISSNVLAYDEDGDPLKYSIVQHPTQGSVNIDEASGEYTYFVSPDGVGNDSFVVSVTDGYVTIEKTINIHVETYIVVDDTYERAFDATTTDVHFSSQLAATDDDGDELSWSVIKSPTLGRLDLDTETGVYSYDSDQGVTGNDSFIIQVTDGVYPIQKEYTIHLYSIKDNGTSLVNTTTKGVTFSSQIHTEAKNTAVSYSIKTQGSFGVATIDASSGEYTYTPNENTRGQDSFVVTVTHTYGSYDLEIFVYQNSIPDSSLVETSIIVNENGSYSGSVACNDLDLNDVLVYQMINNPLKGNISLDGSLGTYVYTPLEGLAGNDSFSVKVNDGINEITIGVDVHIESLIATEASVYRTVSQNQTIQGNLVATDKDGDLLSYALKTGASNGITTVTANGAYSYVPNNGYYGDDSFVVTVTDEVVPVDITIHVKVNAKPIVGNDAIALVANGASINGTVLASDPNDDALTYSISLQPSQGNASVDAVDGRFVYVPNENAAGDDSFLIRVADDIEEAFVTVIVHNETELVIDTSNTNLVANQGKILNGSVVASDADGDVLSYAISTMPQQGSLTINATNGAWSYQCNADATGQDLFEIAVTDGVKEKKVTFNLSINLPPTVASSSILSFTTNQGKQFTGTISGADQEGGTLTYSVVAQGSKGSVTITAATGQYKYTPNSGAAGDDQFVLGISDGHFVTQATVHVHIESDIVVQSTTTNKTVAKGQIVSGSFVVSDADGDELSYTISTQPTKGVASVTQDGQWSFNASGTEAGQDSFIVQVTDGIHTKQMIVYVFIQTNPSFVSGAQTIHVGTYGQVNGSVAAVDLDGDAITYSIQTAPTKGTINLNAQTGEYVYTNVTAATTDSFRIRATDSHSNQVSLSIQVKINTPPTVSGLTLNVKHGQSVSGMIQAIDSEHDVLSYSIKTQGNKGVASVDGSTGKVIYEANVGTSGVGTFVVDVFDGFNHASVTVKVNITGNSSPAASANDVTTKQGESITGAIDVYDADEDVLNYAVATLPAHGTLLLDGTQGTYTYSPNHDYYGVDSFSVIVSDGLASTTIQVKVTVMQNVAPAISDAPTYEVNQGGSCNGQIKTSDSDSAQLAFTVVEGPNYGTVNIDSKTGTFSYAANAFAAGELDSFVVEVNDGFNTTRVLVQLKINSTAMNIAFIAGGSVAYTGVIVAAVLIVSKLRKKVH